MPAKASTKVLPRTLPQVQAEKEYRAGAQREPIFQREGDSLFLTGPQGEVIWIN